MCAVLKTSINELHFKLILDMMENDIRANREIAKEQLAAKNNGLLVHTFNLRGDSYSSYEDRVLMLKKMGAFVGTTNHSEAIPLSL